MREHIVVSIIPHSALDSKQMLFRPREKEKEILVVLTKEPLSHLRYDGGVHTPVRSKLGVYSSFALLFCCI